MKPSTGLWIGLVVVAINALILGQELIAYRNAPPGAAVGFPIWSAITLAGAAVYLLTAGILFDRARRARPGGRR